MAAAIAKVPASSRSPSTRCSTPCRRSTPSISSRVRGGALDARAHGAEHGDQVVDLRLDGRRSRSPSCRAPGSRPACAFSVPITVTYGERDARAAQAAGRRREVVAVAGTRSPRRGPRMASTWRSTGRRPIRSPPGLLMITRPNRASSGPSRMKRGAHLHRRLERHERASRGRGRDLEPARRRRGRPRSRCRSWCSRRIVHVADPRHVAQHGRLVGEGGGGHHLEDRVLGAGDPHLAVTAGTPPIDRRTSASAPMARPRRATPPSTRAGPWWWPSQRPSRPPMCREGR